VKPFNPDSPSLATCEEVWLARPNDETPTRFGVTQSRPHKRVFLVGLQGIESLDDLEPWLRSEVSVRASTLPEVREGEIYHFEALGLQVKTTSGEVVGKVIEVIPLPASDLWVVESSGDGSPREILIPVVDPIVKEVDLPRGLAVVDPPPGLLDGD